MASPKNKRPRKSPHHHLIPEVKARRKKRIWYTLLAITVGYAVFIAIQIHRRNSTLPDNGKGETIKEVEVIQPLREAGAN